MDRLTSRILILSMTIAFLGFVFLVSSCEIKSAQYSVEKEQSKIAALRELCYGPITGDLLKSKACSDNIGILFRP